MSARSEANGALPFLFSGITLSKAMHCDMVSSYRLIVSCMSPCTTFYGSSLLRPVKRECRDIQENQCFGGFWCGVEDT